MKIDITPLKKHLLRAAAYLGKHVAVPVGHGLAAGLRAYGILQELPRHMHDSAQDKYLRALPLSGKIIYEIGGGIGITSIFFSSRTGDKGHVYCFETDAAHAHMIRKNRRVNRFHWLTVITASGAASSLDGFAAGENLPPPALVSISSHDAIGVLRGMKAIIKQHRPEFLLRRSDTSAHAQLEHAGYRLMPIERGNDNTGSVRIIPNFIHAVPKRRH